MADKIFQKNDIVTIKITDMDENGQGIGKADGFAFFVKDTVVGDVAEVKVMKAKKNYGFARLIKVITPSKDRVEPACPYARACGGCQLQEMSYEAELKFKENKVRNNLIRIGGFPEEYIESVKEPIVGMTDPYRYRNKAQYPVGTDKEGKPVAGFYAGHTHDIIANTDCLLGRKENSRILEIILEFLKKEKIKPYNETTNVGLFRHVLIREGFDSGEIMVCFIINGKSFPGEDALCHRLVEEVPEIKSICLNVNEENTNVIMGNSTRVLWGKETIDDTLGGILFKISARSFYQINPVQTERLYTKAMEYAGLKGEESVWDLYCGIGTISLFLAKKAKQVYGVEIVPEAIEDAKENARRNGITNAEFFVGKAEEVLPAFYQRTVAEAGSREESLTEAESREESLTEEGSRKESPVEEQKRDMAHPDVIVVDPPRKGCDEKCLETMLLMEPERIVYVSCDSATLARDLKILCKEKYKLKSWQCYDQFSRTVHVETCCLLERLRNAKDHVTFTLDMEDYYRIKDAEADKEKR